MQTNFSVRPGPGLWSLVLGPFGPDLGPDLDLTWDLDMDLSLTISMADDWHLIGNKLVIDWLEILHYWIYVYWLILFVDFSYLTYKFCCEINSCVTCKDLLPIKR